MKEIEWKDFEKIEIRVGKVIKVENFVKAKKPAYILHIYFGEEIGVKKSSAQIVKNYQEDNLIGKKILAVVNLPKKQIANIQSECLVTGLYDEHGGVYLCVPDGDVPLGAKLL
ncbi:tRNA-binding protein [Elizabethkingia argentiflava]|uniref:tRNA-binding protein n=1 Tax=Elizabethkingia argenteiflava TaxID=2681556 RepID=A0A845Q058_9FLAO|nr:tRNA-binding protein [Elizabethkingia argenteiflava]NAW51710.1 tRNA-binding protein [Elizabethkingia argenteiflava]